MSAVADCAVNGRFLTQPQTGVQRYAGNVVAALNGHLAEIGAQWPLITPLGARDPGLSNLPLTSTGRLPRHAWEQVILPMTWPGRLLNLGNTGPIAKTEQVVCIHDVNVLVAPESYSRAFRWLYGALLPLLAKRSARITTVSRSSAEEIARHLPIRASEIEVLYNGHEHALRWNPGHAERAPGLVASATVNGARPYVLALGSRARHKNLDLLVKAAPGLAELGVAVLVAGGSLDILAADASAPLNPVTMLGRVSDDDLAYLLDGALALVFPSWTEGFGLPVIEAMARGCPVIASDRPSLPEVCGDAALFASPASPSDWVAQVRTLLESDELRADLVGRGRERVKAYSWARTARGYLEAMTAPALGHPSRGTTSRRERQPEASTGPAWRRASSRPDRP